MTDVLIESIREAILPEIRQTIITELRSQHSQELQEKYLSVDEARQMFRPAISRGTLYNWDRDGLINSYMIGGKRLYKYSEMIESVEKIGKYKR